MNQKRKSNSISIYKPPVFATSEKLVVLDINTASLNDFIKVYGIGEVIAQSNFKFIEKVWEGFVAMEQLE